jgi:hypothetical protein
VQIENPIAFSFIMQDELYLLNADKALYINKEAPQPIIETPPVNFNYLGAHKKKFLILVHYPELEFIDEKHLAALQSVLKRLELGMDDVAIFNSAKYADVKFEQLMDFFTPQKLLLLGQAALPEGLETLALNKLQQLNKCNALFSFSFDEMMENNENKKAFWEQMKQL